MIALLNMSGKKMGFRTIHDDINVAEYAKGYGGGGHPKASGSEMTAEAFGKFVVKVFESQPIKPDADRNELNLKEAEYGTSYLNHKGEISYIRPTGDGTFGIIHKGKKQNITFKNFTEAERFLKRNFYSWLQYDQEILRQVGGSKPMKMEELKENYQKIIRNLISMAE